MTKKNLHFFLSRRSMDIFLFVVNCDPYHLQFVLVHLQKKVKIKNLIPEVAIKELF